MLIHVNDKPVELGDKPPLSRLLSDMGVPDKGVAIAINNNVVPRDTWSTRILNDGDRILIIRATQGG